MMSVFDFDCFYEGYDNFAVSAERYTKEEAIKLYCREMKDLVPELRNMDKNNDTVLLAVGTNFVRHRYGRNADNEPCAGWWLEGKDCKRSCPVWVFHIHRETHSQNIFAGWDTKRGYDIINLREWLQKA